MLKMNFSLFWRKINLNPDFDQTQQVFNLFEISGYNDSIESPPYNAWGTQGAEKTGANFTCMS